MADGIRDSPPGHLDLAVINRGQKIIDELKNSDFPSKYAYVFKFLIFSTLDSMLLFLLAFVQFVWQLNGNLSLVIVSGYHPA